jgi:hypothetical protein
MREAFNGRGMREAFNGRGMREAFNILGELEERFVKAAESDSLRAGAAVASFGWSDPNLRRCPRRRVMSLRLERRRAASCASPAPRATAAAPIWQLGGLLAAAEITRGLVPAQRTLRPLAWCG